MALSLLSVAAWLLLSVAAGPVASHPPQDMVPWQSQAEAPPGTPPCDARFRAGHCYMTASPFPSGPPAPPSADTAALLRALNAPPTLEGKEAAFRAYQQRHPDLYPPHAPPGASSNASLCPGCVNPDGSMWVHQSPLLVGGHLLRRTPRLFQPWRHPPLWYVQWTLLWIVLLTPGVYYGTKWQQARVERRHAERVAERRRRAAARAGALASLRAPDPPVSAPRPGPP